MKRQIGLALVAVPVLGVLAYFVVSAGWPDGLYLAGFYSCLVSGGAAIILVSE